MDDLLAQGGDFFLRAGDLSLEVCQLSRSLAQWSDLPLISETADLERMSLMS